jgi:hypothetical protein
MSKSDFDILRQQAEDRAKEATEKNRNWKFVAGIENGFEGTVVRGKVVHANDKRTPILICDQVDTGDRYTVWCGNMMLERAVADLAPAIGSLVVIQFLGPEPSASNPSRTFHNYSMACTEGDFEYWAGLNKAYNARSDAGAEAAQHNEAPVFEGPDEAPF